MNESNDSQAVAGNIVLSGELTIINAADNTACLKEAFEVHDVVSISFRDITNVDLTGLQLLCSAHRTASAANKVLRLPESMPELIWQAARSGGFIRRRGCSFSPKSDCLFWNGGE